MSSECVRVMVRCRPMNKSEQEKNCVGVVSVDPSTNQVVVAKSDAREQARAFTFDCVFSADCSQNYIYEQSGFSLVDSVLDGYNGTIFAYGQTGCGKTHTMMGSNESEEARGIIPRTFGQIVTITRSESAKAYLIRCSFIEIYNEEIHDLLGKDTKERMELKESPEKGVFVKDVTQMAVDSVAKMEELMERGFRARAVRETKMNKESSRSHSIFTITIDSQEKDEKGSDKYKSGKLNLVDLAGSEKIAKTGTTGDGVKEATKINLSLSALGNVISALVDGKVHHIPYRDSKLTRLLQDSLGGNTKTIMIAAISPADYNYEETLSTLRYASRAKHIQNKPRINEDPKDALLREYMEEITRLKLMLEGKLPMAGEGQASPEQVDDRRGDKENSVLAEELRSKERLLQSEQEEKRLLGEKLALLQEQLTQGGAGLKEKQELEKMQKLKERLRAQKKREEEYERERVRREEELLSIEKHYKSLNEEVDEMKARFQEIKHKYTANVAELRDLQSEHEDEKEDLLDTIRHQEKELKKFQAILAVLMGADQLDQIVRNSDWSDERREWTVPAFTYRERTVSFPKLFVESRADHERDKKEVVFKALRRDDKRPSNDGFKMNNIVSNAREYNEGVPNRALKLNSKMQLPSLNQDSQPRLKVEGQPSEKKRGKELLDHIDHAKFEIRSS